MWGSVSNYQIDNKIAKDRMLPAITEVPRPLGEEPAAVCGVACGDDFSIVLTGSSSFSFLFFFVCMPDAS